MRASRTLKILAFTLATSGLPYVASSCSSPTTSPPDTSLNDVVFQGAATPTALSHLLGVFRDPWEWGLIFVNPSPADGQHVDSSSPVQFAYQLDPSVCTSTSHDGGDAGGAGGAGGSSGSSGSSGSAGTTDTGGAAGATTQVAPRARARLNDLWRAFTAERTAHAQSAPFTGQGYFLVFHTADNPSVLRVFTDQKNFAPDNATWQKLAQVRETISVTLSTAQFVNDAITTDCGPIEGQTISITID
ncbi:MAG TPA: hypothetical protein VGI10_10390 [Polyangiaceae bacterium]